MSYKCVRDCKHGHPYIKKITLSECQLETKASFHITTLSVLLVSEPKALYLVFFSTKTERLYTSFLVLRLIVVVEVTNVISVVR